jgi:hypothetical protein
VSSIIHNLRNMAMDMNAELESQNDQIDRITLKVIYIIENGYSKENLFHRPQYACERVRSDCGLRRKL